MSLQQTFIGQIKLCLTEKICLYSTGTHLIMFQLHWLHVWSCQNASHPCVMADQLFTLITSVWEQTVVTWDAVWAVVRLDVLAAVQRLLAVVAVKTVSHGSILEKQKHSRWQCKGEWHTQRRLGFPQPIFIQQILDSCTWWMINYACGNRWRGKEWQKVNKEKEN